MRIVDLESSARWDPLLKVEEAFFPLPVVVDRVNVEALTIEQIED
jgi:hypothetical protein